MFVEKSPSAEGSDSRSPYFWRMEALLPDPHWPSAGGPIGLRRVEAPPQTFTIAPPHDEFLATRLVLIMFKNIFS